VLVFKTLDIFKTLGVICKREGFAPVDSIRMYNYYFKKIAKVPGYCPEILQIIQE